MPKPKDILENFSEKFPILSCFHTAYQQVGEISKNEDNTLRKSAEITVLEILELIVIATRQGKAEKFQTLKQAMRKLDTLKVFADMASDIKLLATNKYNDLQLTLQTGGKMLGGWLKSANPTTTPTPAK
jgi:hypothetical protein